MVRIVRRLVPEYEEGRLIASHGTVDVWVDPFVVTWIRGTHRSSGALSMMLWLAFVRALSVVFCRCGNMIRGADRITTRAVEPTCRASTRAPSTTIEDSTRGWPTRSTSSSRGPMVCCGDGLASSMMGPPRAKYAWFSSTSAWSPARRMSPPM
jgi:hypothetical protein